VQSKHEMQELLSLIDEQSMILRQSLPLTPEQTAQYSRCTVRISELLERVVKQATGTVSLTGTPWSVLSFGETSG
jgi:hypothetical protein